ncbi:MAG: c-type cytochrome [Balneolaceae bacterium]
MKILKTILVTALLLTVACGGGDTKKDASDNKAAKSTSESGLSAFQLEHGIGPITEVITASGTDAAMIKKGEDIFVMNCSACHKVGERYIGPDVQDIIDRRSPTYMMNMILNPDEMVKKHPEARKVLAEFLAPMPNQNLSQEDARAVVEYLVSLKK